MVASRSVSIIFENPSFLVVDKPAGWLAVPGRQGDKDPRPVLGKELEGSFGQIFPVHRLDLEVSGVMLYARTAEAHRRAGGWFESHEVVKTYEAWTSGAVAELSQGQPVEWRSKLLRGKRRAYESPHGKDSLTIARWLGSRESSTYPQGYQLWSLEPRTGRPHQLRYELSHRGWPILGDRLYGSEVDFSGEGIALRAVKLDLSACKAAAEFGLPTEIKVPGIAEVYRG